MNKIVLIILLAVSYHTFSQEGYLDDDLNITPKYHRDATIALFNSDSTNETIFKEEGEYFIVITKMDCGNLEYASREMQEKALEMSFRQLYSEVSAFQKYGFDTLFKYGFKGMVFKTNTICMGQTSRYHFKFEMKELQDLPLYVDFEELLTYVVQENNNENIIHTKNPE